MGDGTSIEKDISHIEIASINFDQWILTIALRAYGSNGNVKGMVHLIFKSARGFRYLDEGDMIKYPFPDDCTRNYVQTIAKDGWAQQENDFGNIVTSGHQEYLIATINECVTVLAYEKPIIIKEL